MFVLVGARPELRDLPSSLVTPGGLVANVVTLGGLGAGAAMLLAANVIGAADLPAAVAAKVLAMSEGNPLFVGELVPMLVDEGAIERQGDRWIVGANLAALEMPPTNHALLAARIERLGPEDRTVPERAAVVGRHFSRSAVAALLGRNGSELNARLEALQRTELIERDTGWFLGEPVLRFHHVLIRDAAYRRLLKGTRAELHEQLADWIEAQAKDAPEHDETIGWHLEQAHQHRRELGPLDAQGKTLGERAAARLAAAGRRALARDDLPVAAGLLGRAPERLAADDPARAGLALDWCEALLASALLAQGRSAEAEALSHESEALAGDDLKAAIAWRGGRAEALAQRGEHAAAVELAQAAVAIATATDALLDHADARLALAAALRAAGRGPDADAEQRRAIELWEAKGATLLIERAHRTAAPVAAPAPTAQPGRAPASRRRLTPNRASGALVAFNAAMAAPDFAAFREQLSGTYEEIDHPTGRSYGRDANVAALQRLMRSRDARCQLEPLATLGDSLPLSRRRVHASATGGGRFDVGE